MPCRREGASFRFLEGPPRSTSPRPPTPSPRRRRGVSGAPRGTGPPVSVKFGPVGGVLSPIVPPVRLTRPPPLDTNDAGELNVCVPPANVSPPPPATTNAPV